MAPGPVSTSADEPLPPPPGAPGDLLVFNGLDEGDFKDVVSLLVAHGVEHLDAQRYVCSLVKGKSPNEPATFFEMYGQGGLSRAARHNPDLNVRGLEVMDLRTLRPDGQPWDFTRSRDRQWALRMIREQKPRWIIGAPPCTTLLLTSS